MRGIAIGRRALLRLGAAGLCVAGSGGAADTASHPLPKRKPAPPARVPVIAIDPGHGGIDPGAISPGGLFEKDVVWPVAVETARQLGAAGHFRPLLTRRGDVFVELRERVARARAWNAELFLSLHADALPDPELRGLSVFTLSEEASDREAAALAWRENKADLVAGVNLSRQSREVGGILLDLARRQTYNRSMALAQALVGDLGHEVVLLERPHRSAGFAVLTAPDIPSALVELGCLSNRDEERLLAQHAYHQRLARGLVRAVGDYWATYATV